MMNKYNVLILSFIPLAFAIGYFLDPHPDNSIVITSQEDLDVITENLMYEMLEKKLYLSLDNITGLAVWSGFAVDDVNKGNMYNPFVIDDPSDYDTWYKYFFNERTGLSQKNGTYDDRFYQIQLKPDEEGIFILYHDPPKPCVDLERYLIEYDDPDLHFLVWNSRLQCYNEIAPGIIPGVVPLLP